MCNFLSFALSSTAYKSQYTVEVDPHSDLLHICLVKPKNISPRTPDSINLHIHISVRTTAHDPEQILDYMLSLPYHVIITAFSTARYSIIAFNSVVSHNFILKSSLPLFKNTS